MGLPHAVGQANQGGLIDDPQHAAVAVAHPERLAKRFAGREVHVLGGGHGRGVVGVDQLVPQFVLHQLLLRVRQEPACLSTGVRDRRPRARGTGTFVDVDDRRDPFDEPAVSLLGQRQVTGRLHRGAHRRRAVADERHLAQDSREDHGPAERADQRVVAPRGTGDDQARHRQSDGRRGKRVAEHGADARRPSHRVSIDPEGGPGETDR